MSIREIQDSIRALSAEINTSEDLLKTMRAQRTNLMAQLQTAQQAYDRDNGVRYREDDNDIDTMQHRRGVQVGDVVAIIRSGHVSYGAVTRKIKDTFKVQIGPASFLYFYKPDTKGVMFGKGHSMVAVRAQATAA